MHSWSAPWTVSLSAAVGVESSHALRGTGCLIPPYHSFLHVGPLTAPVSTRTPWPPCSKLDALASEYNHLLVSQLESQRHYFESQLIRQAAEGEAALGAAAALVAAAEEAAAAARDAAAEAKRRRRGAEARATELAAQLAKVAEEHGFLKQLNDTLLANQRDYAARLREAEERGAREAAEKGAALAELREQVRDLMVFIQARDAIAQADGGAGAADGSIPSELAGATVLPVPAPPAQQGGRGKGARQGAVRRR